MKRSPEKPLILLDRDGTLIEETNYLTDPSQVRFLPGVIEGLKRLKRAGFNMVVVTNQSGIGRGFITLSQLNRVNRRFLDMLKKKNAPVDGLYWCPHTPAARCTCRKPKLGLVKRAAKALGQSWKGSVSVGDRPSDVQLGQRAGGQGVLVLTGYGRQWAWKSHPVRPDHTARDFRQVVSWIIHRQERKKP
jgi:D-glycero-D-manno-heptose 1,7-bisphosphate phosphatase